MREKYRSKLEMYMSILDHCQNDLLLSEIIRKCNLSYYDAVEYLKYLTHLELLSKAEPIKAKDRPSWKLTSKGLEQLQSLRAVHEFFVKPEPILL